MPRKKSTKKMSEVMRDSAIKLFGKTIPLPFADNPVSSDVSLSQLRHTSCATSTTSHDSKDESGGDEYESIKQTEATSSETSEDPETAKKDESSEEKTVLKKPDKIIPCPRCNSMETKFCYYNNYNVNQPRYFCKNCQRYWTSGGTMRNVPVGSGRRKTKHYQSPTNGADSPSLKPSAFLVGFYPAALLWGGMGSSAPPPSVLGKHSREGASNLNLDEDQTRVLIPKTLRIHDPREAAKSSIWSTLGIKNDKVAGGPLFKAFEPKGDRHPRVDRRAMLLQANPAALSRSLNFHESA